MAVDPLTGLNNQMPFGDNDEANEVHEKWAQNDAAEAENEFDLELPELSAGSHASGKYIAYTIKMPSEQLAALQSIWLELKRAYGTNSPDKSGMIQQAVTEWLKEWDGPNRKALLRELLEIRQETRRRQYRK
ncbi:MAG: hypothetical protein K2Y22_04925 [Candidatus Obscuribacterales bacterium]|nr:hypothetical protein [Candidatus Obscuribacterales bacterium]